MGIKRSTLQRQIRFDAGLSLEIHQGDITRFETDAIVNAANKRLQHGGGVAGAISQGGGPTIQIESNAWVARYGPIDFNTPATTSSGDLPCKTIIHAAGPVWGEGDEDSKLSMTITSALQVAEKLHITSISMPAISTGIFGFPIDRAGAIFMRTIADFIAGNQLKYLKRILIVLLDDKTRGIFINAFDRFDWKEDKA